MFTPRDFKSTMEGEMSDGLSIKTGFFSSNLAAS
jgi:hypothetical protein